MEAVRQQLETEVAACNMSIIDQCEFRGKLGGAAVILCPSGLSDEQLRSIDRRACFGQRDCTALF